MIAEIYIPTKLMNNDKTRQWLFRRDSTVSGGPGPHPCCDPAVSEEFW